MDVLARPSIRSHLWRCAGWIDAPGFSLICIVTLGSASAATPPCSRWWIA